MRTTFNKCKLSFANLFKLTGFFVTAGTLVALSAGVSLAAQQELNEQYHEVTVYKTAQCGCCGKWADHLQQGGLSVDVIIVDETESVRSRLGVPRQLAACHTAVAGDFWVEGHVPVSLIKQLLTEKPKNIKGIAVPGMPAGSPGMESPNPVEYKVYSLNDSGRVEVFATSKGDEVHITR